MAWYLSYGTQHPFVVETSPYELSLYHEFTIIEMCARSAFHGWCGKVVCPIGRNLLITVRWCGHPGSNRGHQLGRLGFYR